MGITHLYFGHQDIVLLSSIAIIRPKNNICSNYIYLYLKSSSVQSLIFGGFVSGSALPRLVLKDIKKIPILIPSEKLIIRFNQIIDNPVIQIIENEKQSRVLIAIRDALLPKLMSGEIRVKADDKPINK
jgi:type I restriction enzyme, S subunit